MAREAKRVAHPWCRVMFLNHQNLEAISTGFRRIFKLKFYQKTHKYRQVKLANEGTLERPITGTIVRHITNII